MPKLTEKCPSEDKLLKTDIWRALGFEKRYIKHSNGIRILLKMEASKVEETEASSGGKAGAKMEKSMEQEVQKSWARERD